MDRSRLIPEEAYVILTMRRAIRLAKKLEEELIFDYMNKEASSIELLRDEKERSDFEVFMNEEFGKVGIILYPDFMGWIAQINADEAKAKIFKQFRSDYLLCSLAQVKYYESRLEDLDTKKDEILDKDYFKVQDRARMSTIINPTKPSRRKRVLPGGAGKCRLR